jgi:hypothetical protein
MQQAIVASAQKTFSNTGSGLNDIGRYMDEDTSGVETSDADELEDVNEKSPSADDLSTVTMSVTDSLLSFENLPEKGMVTAYITNAAGEEIAVRNLRADRSGIAVGRLPHDLFFVTLTYRKYRKAFELNRSEK